MSRSTTGRGFAVYDEFTDQHGNRIRIQQSSYAADPCVWVFCEGMGIHLTVEQAKRVRDALDVFIVESAPTPDLCTHREGDGVCAACVKVTEDDGQVQ